jgi:hypothetical protein
MKASDNPFPNVSPTFYSQQAVWQYVNELLKPRTHALCAASDERMVYRFQAISAANQ